MEFAFACGGDGCFGIAVEGSGEKANKEVWAVWGPSG